MRPRCSFRTAPVDASRISAQTPRPPNPTPPHPTPAQPSLPCLPCLPCPTQPSPAQPSPARPTRPRPNRYFAANSLLQLAGRRESQQPLNVNVAGRRESHIHFTPFSGRPKNHIHLTIHFPAGPETNIHFRTPSQHPFYIHFTRQNGCKRDVGWGPKMDVGFRARRKMDVGFRAPPNNGLQNGCGIYAGRATWMQNGCWDSRLPAKWA